MNHHESQTACLASDGWNRLMHINPPKT